MPLEIREINVSTTIEGESATPDKKQDSRTRKPEIDIEYIIEECTRRIKEEMRYQNER